MKKAILISSICCFVLSLISGYYNIVHGKILDSVITSGSGVFYDEFLGGSGFDQFTEVLQTNDDGYLAVGRSTSNDGEITDANNGSEDVLIVKFNEDFDVEWIQQFGGSEIENGLSVIQTSDGGYLIAGFSLSSDGEMDEINNGREDALLLKLDASGNIEWNKQYGGNSFDFFYSVIETFDGDYVAVGRTSSTNGDFLGSIGGYDGVVVKFDNLGNIKWLKRHGGSGDDNYNEIVETSDNGYLIVGDSTSTDFNGSANNGNQDALIVKLDQNGDIDWHKLFGGSNNDVFFSLSLTSDNGFIATGRSSSNDKDITDTYSGGYDGMIVKFDSLGNKEWNRLIGGTGEEALYSTIETDDNSYIITGYSSSTNSNKITDTNNGGYDGLLVKNDSNGIKEWDKLTGGINNDFMFDIVQNKNGALITAGRSNSSNGELSDTNNGDYDALLVAFDMQSPTIDDETVKINKEVNSSNPTVEEYRNALLEVNLSDNLNITNDLLITITDESNLNMNKLGLYDVILNVADQVGNNLEVLIEVEVTLDSPTLNATSFSVNKGIDLNTQSIIELSKASAYDGLNNDLTNTITVNEMLLDTNNSGLYEVELSVVDAYGQTSFLIIEIEVVEVLVLTPTGVNNISILLISTLIIVASIKYFITRKRII